MYSVVKKHLPFSVAKVQKYLFASTPYPEEYRSLAVFLQPALAEEEQNLH